MCAAVSSLGVARAGRLTTKLLRPPPCGLRSQEPSQGSLVLSVLCQPLRHGAQLPQTALLLEGASLYGSWILEIRDSRELWPLTRELVAAVATNGRVLQQRSQGMGSSKIEAVACQLRVHFPLMN